MALFWASFPPLAMGYLAVPALAILFAVLNAVRVGRSTWYGFLFGLGFFLPHIWWATISVGGYLPWFALCLVQALFLAGFGFSAGVVRYLAKGAVGNSVLLALAWVGVEQLRACVPFGGFSWALLAYSQVDLPVRTLAPWGSEVTIGFVCALTASLVMRVLVRPRWLRPGFGFFSRTTALVLAALLCAGPWMLRLPLAQESGSVRVGAVQGNVQWPAEQTFAQHLKVTDNHVKQTLKTVRAGQRADFLVWGENSADTDPREDAQAYDLIYHALEAAGVPILVGSVKYTPTARYNDMLVYSPDGQIVDQYRKQLPVPFGEYVPMRKYLSVLSKDVARVSVDMLPGSEPGFVKIPLNGQRRLPAAIGICFEAAYEEVLAGGVLAGGQLLLMPTNNSSFGNSAESGQLLQMTRLRAMSLSRSAVHVSTNGQSALIWPDGSVRKQTHLFESATLIDDVPLRTSITFSARHLPQLRTGIIAGWGGALCVGVFLAMFRRRPRG